MLNCVSSTCKPGSTWILEAEGAVNPSRVNLMIVGVGEVRPVEKMVMLVTTFRSVDTQAHVTLGSVDYMVMREDWSTMVRCQSNEEAMRMKVKFIVCTATIL